MTTAQSKPHVFLFHGEDSYTVAKKVSAWKDAFEQKYGSQTVSRINTESWHTSEDEFLGACKRSISSQSLFCPDSLVLIENLLSHKTYRECGGSFFIEHIPKLNASTFLVFVERRIDKRLALYKTLCDFEKKGLIRIEEFLIPHGAALSKWIQNEIHRLSSSITPEALSLILKRFDPPKTFYSQQSDAPSFDLWLMSNELHKLAAYASGRSITPTDVDLLCPLRTQAHVFDCIAAFLKLDSENTLRCANNLIYQNGGPDTSAVLGLCSFFQNQFHDMLILKDMSERKCSEQQMSDLLGWKKERVRIVAQQIKKVSLDFLKNAAFSFIDLEQSLKSRPVHPPSMLLHTLARALAYFPF